MSFLAQTDTLLRAEGDAADLQAAVAEPDERSYPSIPGAVREIPDWMARNAPFDVAAYFKPLPPGDNAAPLYLEAIYEFYPTEMWNCVSPAERAARGPALAERLGRTGRLQVQAQGSVSAAQRRRNVLEYRDSFDKLAAAQKRPRCAFETGLDMNARLPHAQSSRQVVRMLNWRVEMWVAQGEPDRALDDVEMALRLSRDLRPRGPVISQLVSVAIDSMTLGDIVPRILNAPALEPADCDRLRDILARHESQAVDPLGEAFRVEYLMLRDLVHRLELKDDLGALFGKPGVSNGEILANE